uniref:Uncharacterized protein n=1 Tax=Panagrolaimus sp. JU765 TaxID=591449 RepID=A0AC34QYF8_9BILA
MRNKNPEDGKDYRNHYVALRCFSGIYHYFDSGEEKAYVFGNFDIFRTFFDQLVGFAYVIKIQVQHFAPDAAAYDGETIDMDGEIMTAYLLKVKNGLTKPIEKVHFVLL